MKTSYLFPHRFKAVSGVVFVTAFLILLGYFIFDFENKFNLTTNVFTIIGDTGFGGEGSLLGDQVYFKLIENDIADEILIALIIVSGIIFGFAKEKHEDEMVASIRLHSLAWATIANYGILLFCYLFIYGFTFFNVLMAAMFSQLIIFIVLFRFKMYRFYNTLQHEE